jgi:putative SOS response-associated peptidase YedK
MDSCTLLTANKVMRSLHDHTSVILAAAEYDQWLNFRGAGVERCKRPCAPPHAMISLQTR